MKMRKIVPGILLAVGILCVFGAVAVYALERDNSPDNVEWNVTLVGAGGQQKTLSYDEIKAMPAYEGWGGFFSTSGIVSGPFKVKGVPLESLCDRVGGVTSSQAVVVYAVDGYSMVFDYDQISGRFDTYDPQTMKPTPHGELKLLLMYREDGKPLSHDEGKPLRVATAGTDKLLVEGHFWVKWINKIEVININETEASESITVAS
jgi:DMSO/TMAO reductase YedYZ molybdopterin-dependent catalytic subunit